MSRQLQKLRMWTGQPVNAPFATPPMALRFVLLVSVLSVTGTLIYGVFSQLDPTSSDAHLGTTTVLRVITFFLLPIVLAVVISTNRAISRILVLMFSLLVAHQIVIVTNSALLESRKSLYVVASLSAALICIIWWLFWSKRMRFYYSMISTGVVPDDLRDSIDEMVSSSRFEQAFSRLGQIVTPYLELAVLILAIIAIVYMFDMTNWNS